MNEARALRALLASKDPAIVWRTQRDLLGETASPDPTIAPIARLLRKQKSDGRFPYPGRKARAPTDYDQLETFIVLLELVSKYGLTTAHPAIARAAEFLFGKQTKAGDFRGIAGTQYTPYYSAAIAAVLVEAGIDDARIDRCRAWLLSMRQDDGGWAIPIRTRKEGSSFARALRLRAPLEPDRAKPSSHFVTGIVLRAFDRRHAKDVERAGRWLATRFFQADAYPDRRAASYWRKLQFPFRWVDVLSALDALKNVGLRSKEAQAWLAEQQRRDGTWRCGYPNAKDPSADLWVTFAACRYFQS